MGLGLQGLLRAGVLVYAIFSGCPYTKENRALAAYDEGGNTTPRFHWLDLTVSYGSCPWHGKQTCGMHSTSGCNESILNFNRLPLCVPR